MKKREPKQRDLLHDKRQHTRWIDARMATVRTAQREHPAMTGDISRGGMQLALVGEKPSRVGRQLAIEVAFEDDLVKFWGETVYSLPKEWGTLVGVRFNRTAPEVQDFLFRRYVCSAGAAPGAAGKDTSPQAAPEDSDEPAPPTSH